MVVFDLHASVPSGSLDADAALRSLASDGDDGMEFFNKEGTKIAKGYVRVVVGDYGPYVEFDRKNMVLDNVKEKWPGSEKKTIKYIWLETDDKAKTKIYWQRKKVPYADYQIGMYYIHPSDLVIEDDE